MKWFHKREKQKKRPARPKMPCLSALALPEDVTGGQARIVLCGRRRALVENLAGVTELTDSAVRLRLHRGGEILITGTGLSLREARRDAAYVEGMLDQITLSGGET